PTGCSNSDNIAQSQGLHRDGTSSRGPVAELASGVAAPRVNGTIVPEHQRVASPDAHGTCPGDIGTDRGISACGRAIPQLAEHIKAPAQDRAVHSGNRAMPRSGRDAMAEIAIHIVRAHDPPDW